MKEAKLMASFMYPYDGRPLADFWDALSFGDKFMAYYRVHEINKAQFKDRTEEEGAEILRRYTRPDND